MRLRYFIVIVVFCAPFITRANVVINEIAWMGTLPKSGESTQAASNNEWIELYNNGSTPVSLENWKVTSEGAMPDFILLGTISANGYFLLERGSDDVVPNVSANFIYGYKNNALSNTGEHLFLKNATGEVVDEVNAASGWSAGDNETKDTMQRSGTQWITALPTPSATNKTVSVSPPAGNSPSSSPSSPLSHSSPPVLGSGSSAVLPQTGNNTETIYALKAYGGENQRVAVGTIVSFLGYATGAKNEVIDNARFLWNFGDGETKEGRIVNHIFQIPGKYTVGLNVSNVEDIASDYFIVEVVPNQITITSVLEGENGFIRFANPSDTEIDLGRWLIDDGKGIRFVIPEKTKIAAKSEVAISNKTSGLLLSNIVYPVSLRFPNMVLALQKFPSLISTSSIVLSTTVANIEETSLEEERPKLENNVSFGAENNPAKNAVLPEENKGNTITSTAKASVLDAPSFAGGRTTLFFTLAVLISAAGAGVFLLFKKFL